MPVNFEVGERNLTKFWIAATAPGDLLVWATRVEPAQLSPGDTMVFTFAGRPIAISKLTQILPPGASIDGHWAEHWKLLHRKSDFIDLRGKK